MAKERAVAATRAFAATDPAAAISGAQLLAVALTASEELLRGVMQKHPLAAIACSLALGAAAGLIPLVSREPTTQPSDKARRHDW